MWPTVEPGEVESQIQKLLPGTALAVEVIVTTDGDVIPSLAVFIVVLDGNSSNIKSPLDLIDGSSEAKSRISNCVHGLEQALFRTLPEYHGPKSLSLPAHATFDHLGQSG
jgi:hypothetical protein